MREGRVKIVNHLGLHARAAAKLVRLAEQFESEIHLVCTDSTESVDATSILNILTLAAAKGRTLQLEIDGEDEDIAFEKVSTLFRDGFDEN